MNETRIIAAPREENDILSEERTRLSSWAPQNGWRYIEYADPFDFLAQISDIALSSSTPIAEKSRLWLMAIRRFATACWWGMWK